MTRLVGRASQWSAARFGGGGIILGYHRVVAVPDDPWHMCVRPEHFAEQLEVVVRRSRPTGLRSMAPMGSRPGHRDLAVTFDDAYIDVLEAALPILERFEVPATVFVVTESLGSTFWWDRLLALHRAALPGRTITLRVDGTQPREITVVSGRPLPRTLHAALRSRTAQARVELIEELRRAYGLSEAIDPPSSARAVNLEQLQRLSAHPLIEIGAHTATHPDLSLIEPDRLHAEVAGCRASLGRLLGIEAAAFAYPHGGKSPAAVAAVRQAGFSLACAGHAGRVRADTPRLELPRLWPPDVDGDGFGRFLRLWTGI